jgi:hypothetical protein
MLWIKDRVFGFAGNEADTSAITYLDTKVYFDQSQLLQEGLVIPSPRWIEVRISGSRPILNWTFLPLHAVKAS